MKITPTFLKKTFVIICSLVLSVTPPLFPGIDKPEREKIHIHLFVDAAKPLTIDYRTKERFAGGMFMNVLLAGGVLAGLGSGVKSDQLEKDSEPFRKIIGEYDRRPILEIAIAKAFQRGSPWFDVIAQKGSPLIEGKKGIDFEKAKLAGGDYVLLVREDFAGMITSWSMGTLSASTNLYYELYDVANKKKMDSGRTSSVSLSKYDFESATKDRALFLKDYPAAAENACGNIYGGLIKASIPHQMAQAHGLGDEVPNLITILDKYEDRFDYKFKLPKHWHKADMGTKYMCVLEPKGDDRLSFGVNFSVDLLIEEFHQKVSGLNEYIPLLFENLKKNGFAIETVRPYNTLVLKDSYEGFIFDFPNGEKKQVILLRQLDDQFVVIYSLVFGKDFDIFLNKYQKDVEYLIDNAVITTRPK